MRNSIGGPRSVMWAKAEYKKHFKRFDQACRGSGKSCSLVVRLNSRRMAVAISVQLSFETCCTTPSMPRSKAPLPGGSAPEPPSSNQL